MGVYVNMPFSDWALLWKLSILNIQYCLHVFICNMFTELSVRKSANYGMIHCKLAIARLINYCDFFYKSEMQYYEPHWTTLLSKYLTML